MARKLTTVQFISEDENEYNDLINHIQNFGGQITQDVEIPEPDPPSDDEPEE